MQVDSFTSEAFKGNPAAVCLLAAPLDDAHLQRIANELNLSETAFVEPVTATAGAFLTHSHFKLRWFTPKSEVPLCGHATLAAAAILSAGECNAHEARPATALNEISQQRITMTHVPCCHLHLQLPANSLLRLPWPSLYSAASALHAQSG